MGTDHIMGREQEHIQFTAGAEDPLRQKATGVVHHLQTAGFTAFWAGGCVRDLLMNMTPKDYDIATDASPDDVTRLFPSAHIVGRSFGVARVSWENAWFEIARFRTDASYTDGRHPDAIRYATPSEDAGRRDFTINALFYDPISTILFDHVDGRTDLRAGILRAVGSPVQRFQEDHLRMLRAVRFAARLGFVMEPATAAAIRQLAPMIQRISAERIRDELTRILMDSPRAGDALVLLEESHLLEFLLPEIAAMRGQQQPPEFHPEGDVYQHTIHLLNMMQVRTPRLAWAALLHDVGKPAAARMVDGRIRFHHHAETGADIARKLLARLRFAHDDIDAISHMVANHMRFQSVQEMRRATLRALVGHPDFPDELELHRLDCTASHGNLANHEFLKSFLRTLKEEPALPPPWITGHDILALDVPEGPKIGHWRQRAYELQLEGKLPDRQAALQWLQEALRHSA